MYTIDSECEQNLMHSYKCMQIDKDVDYIIPDKDIHVDLYDAEEYMCLSKYKFTLCSLGQTEIEHYTGHPIRYKLQVDPTDRSKLILYIDGYTKVNMYRIIA